MPILNEEPSLYPQTLLDDAGLETPDRRWWVIYTKARQEKSLSRDLFASEIPFYLPLVKKTSVSKGRKRLVHSVVLWIRFSLRERGGTHKELDH